MSNTRALYLDLMKKCLTDSIYRGEAFEPVRGSGGWLARRAADFLGRRGLRLGGARPFNPQQRAEGRDWPLHAHTMIGLKRLDNLQFCVESVLAHNVPGDLIEAGVWRGGAAIFMRAFLKAFGVTDRCIWLADSFTGLPRPDPGRYPADAGSKLHRERFLAVSLDEVKANFSRYGLLDEQVCFLKGWFRDTLPPLRGHPWAVTHIDGDLYESTLEALVHLYPSLSRGGYVIIDDYGAVAACRQAVEDYRRAHNLREPLQQIDWTGVWWQRQ